MPIQYPPHVVALASLYVAALLCSFEQPNVEQPGYNSPHQIAAVLGKGGPWEVRFGAHIEDLEGETSFSLSRFKHFNISYTD